MGGLYGYCVVICFAVLITFHSVPAFPELDSWAVNGDYSGVQGLSFRTCARSPPSAGFATLSVFHQFIINCYYRIRCEVTYAVEKASLNNPRFR